MGKLINSTAMTVDGLTDVSGWFVAEGEHDADARAQFDGAVGMVMGYPTYEGLAGFWTQETGEWADMLNPMRKFVASRKPSGSLGWNATYLEGEPAQALSRLKEEHETDLVLIGCGELARYLLAKGVVDEVRFWVHPAIWGDGTRPYGGDQVRLRLIETKGYPTGVILARYEPLGVCVPIGPKRRARRMGTAR